jgi:hypothetical protein
LGSLPLKCPSTGHRKANSDEFSWIRGLDRCPSQSESSPNAAIEETGAVLMGRRTFEMGDPDSYVGDYEFQVPIFELTHHPPAVQPKQDEHLTFTAFAS